MVRHKTVLISVFWRDLYSIFGELVHLETSKYRLILDSSMGQFISLGLWLYIMLENYRQNKLSWRICSEYNSIFLSPCHIDPSSSEYIRKGYQSEAFRWGSPAFYSCQWPLLQNFLGPLIHTHHWVFGNTQQTRNQLVFAFHFFLKQNGFSFKWSLPQEKEKRDGIYWQKEAPGMQTRTI